MIMFVCVCLNGPGSAAGPLSPAATLRLWRVQHLHYSCVQCQSSCLSQSSRRSHRRAQYPRRRVIPAAFLSSLFLSHLNATTAYLLTYLLTAVVS